MKSTVKIIAKIMIGMLLSLILASVLIYVFHHVRQDVIITQGQFISPGYTVEDGNYIKAQKDAKIQIDNLNTYVENLTIKLKQPVKKDTKIVMYYAYNGNLFSRDLQKTIYIKKGDNQGSVQLNKKPYALRFDFDGVVNSSWKIDRFEIKNSIAVLYRGVYLEQIKIIIIPIFILLSLLLFPWKKVMHILFSKRILWGTLLLIYFVSNKYNYSSVNHFSNLVQDNIQTEYSLPIFGKAREIRSDEWNVSTPNRLSAQYNDYGKVNRISMASHTPNMAVSGMHRSYAALSRPETWAYYITNTEYGISFQWNFILIFGFLANFELFLIFSKRNKLVSLMGTCMLMFSSIFQWFSQLEFIWITPFFLVGVYYFWNVKSLVKRILWGFVVAVSAARFVVMLYPAFQIPVGFFILILFTAFTCESIEQIKEFKKIDWITFAVTIIFSLSIIAYTIYDMKDYIITIQNTVYPGTRISSGGMRIQNIFNYIQTIKYPFIDVGNASEKSTIINLFPIGILGTIIIFVRKKKIDIFMFLLMLYTLFLLWYTTIGIPVFLAKITLFSMTTDLRAVQVIAYIQVFFLVYMISRQEQECFIRWYEGIVMAVITVILTLWEVNLYDDNYNSGKYMLLAGIILGFIAFFLVFPQLKHFTTTAMCVVIALSLMIGIPVNPINKGLEGIYDKPVEQKVREIAKRDPNAIWLAVMSYPSMLVANGARTLNSVNYMPNLSFWETFKDNDTITPDIYNRYSYLDVSVVNGKSVLSLVQTDVLHLDFSYSDLKKRKIKYIQTLKQLDVEPTWNIKEIYNDSNAYIYEVQ